MAARAGFGWGGFFTGVIATFLALVIIAAIVVLGGLYPVAATKGDPYGIAWLLNTSMEHGVKQSAEGLEQPKLSAGDIREGGGHFKGMCQQCHGGPGVEPEEFATAMNPQPPDLSKEVHEWTVPQVFWIAKHGIKMSGMPAFGKVDEDRELWKIAGFVKQLPKVSASEYAAIPNAHEHEEKAEGDKAAHSH